MLFRSRLLMINFISGMGLFWYLRWKAILEALVNLVLSLVFILVFNLGIGGILFATTCSNLIINILWEPYIVFHKGLKRGMKKYLIKYFCFLSVTWAVAIILNLVAQNFMNSNLIELIVLLIIGELLLVGVFLFATSSMPEAKFFRQLIVKKLFRR